MINRRAIALTVASRTISHKHETLINLENKTISEFNKKHSRTLQFSYLVRMLI